MRIQKWMKQESSAIRTQILTNWKHREEMKQEVIAALKN